MDDEQTQLSHRIQILQQKIVEQARKYIRNNQMKNNKKEINTQQLQRQVDIKKQPGLQNQSLNNIKQDKQIIQNKIKYLINDTLNKILKMQQIQKSTTIQKINNNRSINKITQVMNLLAQYNQIILSTIWGLIQIITIHIRIQNQSQQSLIQLKQNLTQKCNKMIKQILIPPQISRQLTHFQTQYHQLSKYLAESQQLNNKLKQQLQQNQTKLNNFIQKLQQKQKIISLKQKDNEIYRNKLQQLQLMKKQYLKAYSQIKAYNQYIQIKIIDLQKQLQLLKNKQIQQQTQISPKIGNRLNTIVQHSQDQLIQQIIRQTQSQNTLSTIRQLIELGLMSTNHSKLQRYIKQALIKLQKYQIRQQQDRQNRTSFIHTDMENNINFIHDGYKILLGNVKKIVNQDKQHIQKQFNRTVNKIIKHVQIRGNLKDKTDQVMQPTIKLSRVDIQQSQTTEVNCAINLNKSEAQEKGLQGQQRKVELDTEVYELIWKVKESQQRYREVKKKYQSLMQKQDFSRQNSRVVVNSTKYQIDFNKFMNKLLASSQNKETKQKFTQDFFSKISQTVFQILCNLPIGQHGQVFFMPTSQQQLEDALQIIYKFSLLYDTIQQTRLNQFKHQVLSLTKVLQEIIINNQVASQIVLGSIHKNLSKQEFISRNQIKCLIKKLAPKKSYNKIRTWNKSINSSQSVESTTKQEN